MSSIDVYVPMNCSVYQLPFIAVARTWDRLIFNSKLRLLRNHPLQPGVVVHKPVAFPYDVVESAHGWSGCPYCGAVDSRQSGGVCLFWECDKCRGVNCAGRDAAGFARCSCGFAANRFVSRGGRFFVPRGMTLDVLAVTYRALVIAR
jgi:hypothetical protein